MTGRTLTALSIIAQLLTVFPFAVLCEGVAFGGYTWWHFFAYYAAFAVFYISGRFFSAWAGSSKRSRSFRSFAAFLSRAAVALPIIAFVVASALLSLSTGVYLYALPAGLIMYHAGYTSHGKGYSDIFTRGWFALFFVAAIVAVVIISFVHEPEVKSGAAMLLCGSFGVLIVLAAVLTNQTNIDICTHQRDAGRVALPKGLRAYNSALVAAVVAVIVALLFFAAPLAGLFWAGIKQIFALLLTLLQGLGGTAAQDDVLSDTDPFGGGFGSGASGNGFASALAVLLIVGILVLVIKFRKQIVAAIKGFFAPLFRVKEQEEQLAYMDELSDIPDTARTSSRRKREQQLYKLYRKETDPVTKYRIGYRLMLMRLELTSYPPVPPDSTDIHKAKCKSALFSDEAQQIISVYNAVRYNGSVPTPEQLSQQEGFINDIRRAL